MTMARDSDDPIAAEHINRMRPLIQYLSDLNGANLETDKLAPLLKAVWNEFEGGMDSGMAAYKIDRMNEAKWQSPILSFVIERHGAAKYGSSRAERQWWQLNLETRQASNSVVGSKQLRPMNAPLDVRPLVDEVFAAIETGSDHRALVRKGPNEVKVLVSELVPGAGLAKQTLQGRRARFRAALDDALNPCGWRASPRSYTYKRPMSRPAGI